MFGKASSTSSEGAGNGLATKILMFVLAALWAALGGAYYRLSDRVDGIKDDTATLIAAAAATKASVERMDRRQTADDDAATVEATDQRNRSAARITELEGLERQRDRAAGNEQ